MPRFISRLMPRPRSTRVALLLALLCAVLLAITRDDAPAQQPAAPPAAAQAPAATTQAPGTAAQAPASGQQSQPSVSPAGSGPGGATGPVVIPHAAPPQPSTQPPPPPPPPPPEQRPQYSVQVNVPEVQVPVTVETRDGQFIPRLTAAQFRLTEDGVPQTLDKVETVSDAPMTAVLLVEFRNTYWQLVYPIILASYYFTNQIQPQDWIALESYDLKPTIVVDFTHNKQAILEGLNSLRFPMFSEADLYDTLADMIDRLNGIKEGNKVIVLIATGANTMSSLNWDQLRKKLAESQGVTIFTVSMTFVVENNLETRGGGGPATLNFLIDDQQLRYIASTTGGRYYQPRFQDEINQDFSEISDLVRHQYILSYVPTNKALDGTYRKVRVELVGSGGQPLKVVDQKGKPVKYDVTYRDGYWARHVVE